MSFIPGVTLTAAQLNAAFAGKFDAGAVSTYGATIVLAADAVTARGLLGLPSGVVNAANGTPQLDSGAKIPISLLPSSVAGALNYVGTWNANTNTPTLVNGTGTKGAFYKVSVAGTTTIDGNSNWNIGDLIVFDGTTWDRIDGSTAGVVSVAGKTGVVTLVVADVTNAASKLGDTFSGNVTIQSASVGAGLLLKKAAGAFTAFIQGYTGTLLRWSMAFGSSATESGSNVGSDFSLTRADDTGAVIDTPLTITRSTGIAAFLFRPTFAGNTAVDLGNLPALLQGYLFGLALSRASSTTFGVAAGTAKNDDGGTGYHLTLASAITKSLSAWAVGTGNGGLDTGSVAATTWYHIHLIRKDSDGSIDALYSLSATSPTMPAGYTARRRLGSILTNGSSQIVAFSQNGDEFLWDAAVIDADATNPGTSAVLRTLSVPTGVTVYARIVAMLGSFTTAANSLVISSPAVSDQAGQGVGNVALTAPVVVTSQASGTQWDSGGPMDIRTNTSGQIRTRLFASGASDHVGIITKGWIDPRGRI